MSIDRTTIGEIINRLEKLGYIRKEDDPEDRRSSILYVSDRGRIIQPEVLEALNEVKIGLNRRLSQQDQEQLVDLLKKFRLNSI